MNSYLELENIMSLNWVNIDRFVHLCIILNVMSVISNLLFMIIEPQQIIYSYIFKIIVSCAEDGLSRPI